MAHPTIDYAHTVRDLQRCMEQLIALEMPLLNEQGPVRRLSAVVRVAVPLLAEPMRLADPNLILKASFDPETHVGEFCNLLRAVFQAILTNLHSRFEEGLHQWCGERGIVIKVNRLDQWDELLKELGKLTPRQMRLLKKFHPQSHMSSQDVTDAVTKLLPEKESKTWRKYFKAFATVRNKLSHPQTQLTNQELDAIRTTTFERLMADADLVLNFDCYVDITKDLIAFYQRITAIPHDAEQRGGR